MKYWVECTHRYARVMTGKISIVATIGVEDPTSKDSVKRAENAALEVANALEEEARQTEELRLNIEKSLLEREQKRIADALLREARSSPLIFVEYALQNLSERLRKGEL